MRENRLSFFVLGLGNLKGIYRPKFNSFWTRKSKYNGMLEIKAEVSEFYSETLTFTFHTLEMQDKYAIIYELPV